MECSSITFTPTNATMHNTWQHIKISPDVFHLHPTSITQIVKIFSASVLGATLPNPTDVKLLNVKYSAVM